MSDLIITLQQTVQNASLQLGDVAYFVTPPSNTSQTPGQLTVIDDSPKKIGIITNIQGQTITIRESSVVNEPNEGDFLMFSKDKNANNTSLVGYYAEVKLENDSTEKAELFALSSEIALSSK